MAMNQSRQDDSASPSLSPPTAGHAQHDSSSSLSARRDPPRKRNRAALSCVACRERKIKCNRQVPCDQCVRRGDAELCFLDPFKRGPPANQSKSATVQAQLAAQAEQVARREQQRQQQQHQQLHSGSPQYHRPVDHSPSNGRPSLPHTSSSGSSNSHLRGHSDAEFDAIKNRLAQLESLLAGSGRLNVSNLSPPVSTTYPDYGLTASSQNTPYPATALASQPTPPVWASTGPSAGQSAPSNSRNGAVHALYPQANQFAMASSSARRSASPMDDAASDRQGSASAVGLRSAHDSDTEDAAMVLEGLAMSGQDKGSKSACPVSADVHVDPVKTEPPESLASYAARNRERDIMLDVSQGGTSGLSAADVDACRSEERNGKSCMAAPSGKTLEDLLNLERQGIDVSPAEKVCKLLRSSTSLFRPIYGPESYLGFGMGWAFPAAEAAKDLHVKGGECAGSAQREAVLRAIIRTLPRKQLADQLVSVYGDRVNFLAGNILHMPSFRKEVEAFYALASVERQARVVNNVDSGWLAVFLLVIGLALRFYPCAPPKDWESMAHLFDGRSIHLYASAARTVLVLSRFQSSQSLTVLQSILLSNLSDTHAGRRFHQTMLRIAISNAQMMGLHRLGDKAKQPRAGESAGVAIRREIAKRIWYQLVFKDWSSAVTAGVYAIHERQFNTPLPGNYNDGDLENVPLPPPRPRNEFTDMSYSLEVIEVVKATKFHADLVNERVLAVASGAEAVHNGNDRSFSGTKLSCSDASHLDAAYRNLLEKLPSFFAVGQEDASNPNVEIQRWLVHQMIFHNLLKLHRPALSSRPEARTSCVALARSILYTQKKLRSRCTVIDRLLFNLAQSYTAAIVLLLDLLQHGHNHSPSMRLTIRAEVAEALRALHHVNESNNSTAGGIRVIEALLQEEESRHAAAHDAQNATNAVLQGGAKKRRTDASPKRKDLLSLALRIAKAVKIETECKSQQEQVERDRQEREAVRDDDRIMKAMHEDVEMDASPNAGVQAGDTSTNHAQAQKGTSHCEQELTKDALSRALMEQLFFPVASGGSGPQQTSDSAAQPLTANAQTSAESYAYNRNLYNSVLGGGSSGLDSSMMGPNGVEAGFSFSPTDGGLSGFDLGSFLAQYDGSSPDGSGSSHQSSNASVYSADESNHSAPSSGSLGTSVGSEHGGFHDKRQGSGSSGYNTNVSSQPAPSHSHPQQVSPPGLGPEQTSSGHVSDHTAYGMDAFYNWVLSQGVNAAGADPLSQQQQSQSSADQRQNKPSVEAEQLRAVSGGDRQQSVSQLPQYSLSTWQPPLGGPPQNVWPTTNGLDSTAQMPHFSNLSGSSAPSGLTPLPSTSYNLGTPSTSASATMAFGSNPADPNSTIAAGWLSTPNLFEFGN